MKRILSCVLVFIFTMFIAVNVFAGQYYYNDFSSPQKELIFINENGSAQMTYSEEGSITIATNRLCYPAIRTNTFKYTGNKLIIDMRDKIFFNGMLTVRLFTDVGSYTVASFSGNYEWTTHQIVVDFKKLTADLYTDGEYISSTIFAEGAEALNPKSIQVNFMSRLNISKIQYDYIAVYEASEELSADITLTDDGKTIRFVTSNPLTAEKISSEIFNLSGNQVLYVKADENMPCTYNIGLAVPVSYGKQQSLSVCSITDIVGNTIDAKEITVAGLRDIDILSCNKTRYADNTIKVTVEARNNTIKPRTCSLFVILYNSDGSMNDCRTHIISVAGNSTTAYETERIAIPKGITYKCYLWSSTEGMKILN